MHKIVALTITLLVVLGFGSMFWNGMEGESAPQAANRAWAGGANPPGAAAWPGWGGPNGDFTVETTGLAGTWPEAGPPRLWRRRLGDGYSSIAVEDGVLYTMYRSGQNEFTVALDATNGETIWQHRNASPYKPALESDQYCPGPNTTPLVREGRLYTVGTDSLLLCLDKRTGNVLWQHDLIAEFHGRAFPWGYAASPLAYKNMVIVVVSRLRPNDLSTSMGDNVDAAMVNRRIQESRTAPALVAFDQVTGKLVWRGPSFDVDHSSPVRINFQGEEQIVLLLSKGIMAVHPDSGKLLWHQEFEEEYGNNMTPVWMDDDLLVSSDGRTSLATKLTRKDGKMVATQVWSSAKIRFPQNNPVRVGDQLIGSSGATNGRAIILGIDARTGKRLWAQRGFKLATCVYGDGKLILLDEDGTLALSTATPDGLTVHAQCRVTKPSSWTTPTLVGTTLYVRDRQDIMALDLG